MKNSAPLGPQISTPDPRVNKLHDLHGIPTSTIAEILWNPVVSPHMNRALRASLWETLPKSWELYPALDSPLSDEVRKKFKLSAFEWVNPAFPGATFMGKCQIGKLTPIAMQNAYSAAETVLEVGVYSVRVKERVLSFTGGQLWDGEFMYFDQKAAQRLWTLPENKWGWDSWEEMNKLVKWDSNNFYNLGRILQIALNGWVHPSYDLLYDAGGYADLWSRDDRECLFVSADRGCVIFTDIPTFGHSVRLLDA